MIQFAVTVMGIGFVAAQGCVIFITAWLAYRVLKLRSSGWKLLLMLVSYLGWIILTGFIYTVLGGEWGMMDGGMFILGLFGAAAISSAVYALIWQVVPMMLKAQANG